MKTVLLALDGLDSNHLEQFSSTMPAVTALRDHGVSSGLEATIPPTPGSVWPSLTTGTDPGSHGVFGETVSRGYPGTERHTSAVDIRRPTLWEYLSSEGTPSLVVGVPMTDPPGPLHGLLLPGSRVTRPDCPPVSTHSDLDIDIDGPWTLTSASTAADTVGQNDCEHSPSPSGECSSLTSVRQYDVPAVIDCRRRVAQRLLETEPWELAVIHAPVCEPALSGRVVEDIDSIREAYEAADRLVASVLETVSPETTVMVCSPTGVQRVEADGGYRIHLNELLVKHGLLERHPGERPTSMTGVFESTLRSAARRLGLDRFFDRNNTAVSEPDTQQLVLDDRPNSYEWTQSRAFCRNGSGHGIRINLAGRERYGRIVGSQYETIRSVIIDSLSDLRTPDGKPAFEFVCAREHLYDGPFVREGPDILVSTGDTGSTISAARSNSVFTPLESQIRTREGLFIAAGPAVAAESTLETLTLPDVAPTVMGTLGRPIPELMTGTVPAGLLCTPTARGSYPSVPGAVTTTDPTFDDALLGERLEEFDFRG